VSWPQIVFGGLLVAVLLFLSLFYAWRQVRALRELRARPNLPAEEVHYEHGKAWRRLINCGLTLVLAGLLAMALLYLEAPAQALADRPPGSPPFTADQRDFVRLWGWNWIVILLVLLLVVALAGVDVWATHRYGLRQLRQLQADRRAMIERQVARLREEQGEG
jgi:hypothetical protein